MNDYQVESIQNQITLFDTRLDNHIHKMDQRIDQLIHLMQLVASLQEKQSSTDDQIKDIKDSLKSVIEKMDKSVERLHQRLEKNDEILQQDLNVYFDRTRELSDKLHKTDAEIEKWTNRGMGLWIGISIIVAVVQVLGGIIISGVKDDYEKTKHTITMMQQRQNEQDQEIMRLRERNAQGIR